MGKTYKHGDDNRTPRNNVARGMIMAGTGRKQVFKDRRDKRGDNPNKQSWQEDYATNEREQEDQAAE